MTPGQLLVELFRRGVRVEADGDRLRYSPRSRVPPELVELMCQHKPALLQTLGRVMFSPKPDGVGALPVPSGVYETPPAPREAAGSVDDSVVADGWLEGDEVPDVEPCDQCGSLEQWETCDWPRRWRCSTCDPPARALRVLEHLSRLR